MKTLFNKIKEWRQENIHFLSARMDVNLFLDLLFINIFGIIMIYSASYIQTKKNFFANQFVYAFIGFIFMVFISRLDMKILKHPKIWFTSGVLALVLPLLLLVPGLRSTANGASRWLKIGPLSFQVAEPVKLLFIVFVAGYLSQFLKNKKGSEPIGTRPSKNSDRNYFKEKGYKTVNSVTKFNWLFLYVVLLVFLIFVLSKNLSTAIIIGFMGYLTILINTRKPKRWLIILLVGIILAVGAVIFIDKYLPFSEMEDFRITRIRAWLHPLDEQFTQNKAYQANLGNYAVASGGFFGKGLGQSLMKFRLPEAHNDYILTIIFEELGIVGALFLTYLFGYMLYRIYKIYEAARDIFSKLLVLGVLLHLGLQISLNYAVCLGLLPTTGITLPFVSAGGAATFFSLIELSLVFSVDRDTKETALFTDARIRRSNDDPYYGKLIKDGHIAPDARIPKKKK